MTTNTTPKVYISGPISGLDFDQVVLNFMQAEELLKSHGFTPVSPLSEEPNCTADPSDGFDCLKVEGAIESGPGKHSWQCYMKNDIKMLLDCDAIFMLPGWNASRGAQTELWLARRIDIKLIKLDKSGDLTW